MGNVIAIRILTRPGQEVLADARSHVVQYEMAGMAVLSGVMPRIVHAVDGLITAADIRGAIRPAAYHRSDLGAVVLENTHNLAGGTVADEAHMRDAITAAHDAGLPVHVDGARLWNAAIALGVAPRAAGGRRGHGHGRAVQGAVRARGLGSCSAAGCSSTRRAASASSWGEACARSASWPRPGAWPSTP